MLVRAKREEQLSVNFKPRNIVTARAGRLSEKSVLSFVVSANFRGLTRMDMALRGGRDNIHLIAVNVLHFHLFIAPLGYGTWRVGLATRGADRKQPAASGSSGFRTDGAPKHRASITRAAGKVILESTPPPFGRYGRRTSRAPFRMGIGGASCDRPAETY